MSKRSDRREAERQTRKLAYQQLRQERTQPEPAAVAIEACALAEVPALFQTAAAAAPEISEAQLAANRANAQLSTGPTSAAGKEISSRNNFRHGLTQTEGDLVLLDNESSTEYSRALAAFQAEWQPVTPTDHDLVERLASRQWLRRRAMKLQKLYLASDGQITDEKQFALYRRYEVQHERAYNKALSDLIRLRSLRLREQNGFESQRRKEELHTLKIQALKDRETRNQFAMLEAQARYSLAQMRLINQRTADILNEAANPEAQTEEHSQRAPKSDKGIASAIAA